MFAFLDVSTAYFIAGLMYFIMPLIVWGSLRNIVEQHNADITLSNAPEGGALVQITFPALER